MKNQRGRKKMDDPREIRKVYRFNRTEYETLQRAVMVSGKLEAEFVRDAILREAERILK